MSKKSTEHPKKKDMYIGSYNLMDVIKRSSPKVVTLDNRTIFIACGICWSNAGEPSLADWTLKQSTLDWSGLRPLSWWMETKGYINRNPPLVQETYYGILRETKWTIYISDVLRGCSGDLQRSLEGSGSGKFKTADSKAVLPLPSRTVAQVGNPYRGKLLDGCPST
ncbi:uncharacterized protein LOC142467525 [Ascaphus truei]|uniref:uncharacterized protein LOC142467525 n=1 Tax=Ascaphus truei TaxID=8439 RepID=UPI003F5A03EB